MMMMFNQNKDIGQNLFLFCFFLYFYINDLSLVILVYVTEQNYVSIFFTRLWSVHKPMLF